MKKPPRKHYKQHLVDEYRQTHKGLEDYTDWDVWAMIVKGIVVPPRCVCGKACHTRQDSTYHRDTVFRRFCSSECSHKFSGMYGKGVPCPEDFVDKTTEFKFNRCQLARHYQVSLPVIYRWIEEKQLKNPRGKDVLEQERLKIIKDNPGLTLKGYTKLFGLQSDSAVKKLNEKYNLGLKSFFERCHESEQEAFEILSKHHDLFSKMCMPDIAAKLNISYEYVKQYRKLNDLPIYYRPATSKTEKELCEYVRSLGFPNAGSRKITLDGKCYEVDVYIPELKIGFEYNGSFWHSDIILPKNYHQYKTNLFVKHGISIIHVWEADWLHRREIVQSVIRSKLNKTTRVYARKCVLREITSSDARMFFDANHLKGFARANYHIGLFHDGALVMCCSFGKAKKDGYAHELIRMAAKLNTTVVGGFSKILNYFLSKHPGRLYSYVDKDISHGKGYFACGFYCVRHTPPSYWYISKAELENIPREKFMKHKLTGWDNYFPSKTEFEIVDETNKYYRAWNSGNMFVALDSKQETLRDMF